MSYKKTLVDQWDKLIDEFAQELGEMQAEELSLAEVNDWYTVHAFRWSSMVEPEGRSVSEIKDDEFRRQLLDTISSFRFREAETVKKPEARSHALITLGAMLITVFSVLFLFGTSFLRLLMLIVAFISGGFLSFAVRLDRYNRNGVRRLGDSYLKQLEEYKEKLEELFEKNEKASDDGAKE